MKNLYAHSVLCGLVVILSACNAYDSGGDQVEADGSSGRLVIIGGALDADNTPIYQAILDGRSGDGPICVFPTASADPEDAMVETVGHLDAAGGPGTAQGILLTVDNPEDAGLSSTVDRIQGCSGFYFSGGSQSRIADVFRPGGEDSPAYRALVKRFEEGAVVSGSSAGAAIMSDPMIAGGSSQEALTEGLRGEDGDKGVFLQTGLGFLSAGLIDQHFLARGRWVRLLVAVLEKEEYDLGIGIDENTALVVEGDSARVLGASGAVVFDAHSAVPEPNGLPGASGVRVFLLGAGDALHLDTRSVRFSSDKAAVALQEPPPDPMVSDLLEDWRLLRFFADAAASPDSVFSFSLEGYRFRVEKGPGFQGLARPGKGVQDAPRDLAVGPFLLGYGEEGSP